MNPSAGASSKQKAGASQPSETSYKRKRGVFQKECELWLRVKRQWISNYFNKYLIIFCVVFGYAVQHMMYGFGDDPNVSFTT